ncbi:hypothetical protein M0R45_037899 [Rubus argutus]|uniref:Uncharacterized protein n=1 Tax=Rubus argutus TaxID=59490 RepID=A0AAW1W3R0_RUBAR
MLQHVRSVRMYICSLLNPKIWTNHGIAISEAINWGSISRMGRIVFLGGEIIGKEQLLCNGATYKGILRDGTVVAVKSIGKTCCKTKEAEFLKGENGSNDACSDGSSGHLANEDSDGVQGQNEATDSSSDEVSIIEQVDNNEQDVESGKLAGLILKNALDAKEQHRKFELGQRWIALDPTAKATKEDEGPVTLQAVEFWSSICDIEENISKPDWRQREAATYAFGSVLEGPSPEKLINLVNHALSFMLNARMKDPNNHMIEGHYWLDTWKDI